MSTATTNSTQLGELLALYALHLTDPTESQIVEDAVRRDPAIAAELASLRSMLDGVLVNTPLVNPTTSVRGRLIASATNLRIAALELPSSFTAPVGRFEPFVLRIAAMFDVTVARARELLSWIDDHARWSPPIAPGVELLHFAGGPACAGMDTGFVRVAAGARFPHHAHIGDERSLVLAGQGQYDDGGTFVVGEESVFSPGSSHSFVASAGGDLIYAVRVAGVTF